MDNEKRPASPGEKVYRLRRLLNVDLNKCPLRITYEVTDVTGPEGVIGPNNKHNCEVSKRIMRALCANQVEPTEVKLKAIRQEMFEMNQSLDYATTEGR